MALPFIAGIAIGAGVAFAFSKRDEIAKSFKSLNLDQKIQDGINLANKQSPKIAKQTKPHAKNQAANQRLNQQPKIAKTALKPPAKPPPIQSKQRVNDDKHRRT